MLRNWNPLESHILVTKSKKKVAFFVLKICVYGKKVVTLRPKSHKNSHKNSYIHEKVLFFGSIRTYFVRVLAG
jgi:hypothetical protein